MQHRKCECGCGASLEGRNPGARFMQECRETKWIPTSVIHDDSEVYEPGHEVALVANEWWANKQGLSDSPERNQT